MTVLRKFAYLLDQSDLDFQEELEVTRLREEVVTKIRSNQQLEKDLNLMDIKIGLLVKNRITLQVSRFCSGSLGSMHFPMLKELRVTQSQLRLEGISAGHLVQTHYTSRGTQNRLPRTMSRWLIISNNGDSTI